MGLIKLTGLGDVGFLPDQEGYELPPNGLVRAENVRMRAGWAERVGGYQQILTTAAVVPYGLFAHSSATKDYIVHAGLAAVYVDDGVTRTDITGTPPTGVADDKWTGGTLGGLLLLNNGVDAPFHWDNNTANNLGGLTNWPSGWTCKSLRPFKNFALALNVTKSGTAYPHTVAWSDSAEPGSLPADWAASATNDAGEFALSETPDAIVDGFPIGDTFCVYKERSMYGMQYIGGNDIFRQWRMPGEVGALARNCVAITPVGHVVLTQGDVILHNGQGPRSIIDGKARKWLFNTISSSRYRRSFLVVNHRRQEVWVCFPETGSDWANTALVWCWSNDTVSTRDLPTVSSGCAGVLSEGAETYATVSGTYASIVGTYADFDPVEPVEASLFMAGQSSSKIYEMDAGSGADGASFEALIERTGLHLESPEKVKVCRGVWPRIDDPTGAQITVQIGASMDPETAPTWSSAQTFTAGTDVKIDSFATGRYLAYRVNATGTQNWRLRGLDLDVVMQGGF